MGVRHVAPSTTGCRVTVSMWETQETLRSDDHRAHARIEDEIQEGAQCAPPVFDQESSLSLP